MMSRFLSLVYCAITTVKCQIVRLRGGSISIGRGTTIHPSVALSAGGGRIVIGEGCCILKGAILSAYGGSIVLGKNVSVNPYSILYGHGGTVVGDDVRIAAHVVIIPAEHVFEDKKMCIHNQGIKAEGIKIGKDVWIASGVKILDGSEVSDGCVIGANAVVKGKTEPYCIYAGVPARKIKERK